MAVTRAALLALLAVACACSGGPTTILVQLDGPTALTSFDLTVTVPGAKPVSRSLAVDGGRPLDGTLIVELPDRALEITLDVVAHGAGPDRAVERMVMSEAHHQVKVTIDFNANDDLGSGGDDLQSIDLRVPAGTDLSQSVDLAHPDLAPGIPSVRIISTSYFTNYDGPTFGFPAGMSTAGFVVDTTGVVDGDLLIMTGNIDNGGNSLWPSPIAAGFQQLAQAYYGSDGQTYFVDWKIAGGEPASYSGTYGAGAGSGSAVITLIAVSGANRVNPINAFLAHNGNLAVSPVPATSPGVTSTAANCAIVYTAGSDWVNGAGTAAFTTPAGFTSLLQIGDHGDLDFDWTSQMVSWKLQPSPGPTGTISGTLSSIRVGTGWTAVIAVSP